MTKTKKIAGESLIETLIAILICVMAALTVSTAIVKSAELTSTGDRKLGTYYEKNNELVQQQSPDAKGSLSVEENGRRISLLPDGETEYEVEYFINEELAGDAVISYKTK